MSIPKAAINFVLIVIRIYDPEGPSYLF